MDVVEEELASFVDAIRRDLKKCFRRRGLWSMAPDA
jgi:hypothetical protein